MKTVIVVSSIFIVHCCYTIHNTEQTANKEMDLPSVFLLLATQEEQSFEDHTTELLDLAFNTHTVLSYHSFGLDTVRK